MLHATEPHADCLTTRVEIPYLQGVSARLGSLCAGRMQSVAQIKPFILDLHFYRTTGAVLI